MERTVCVTIGVEKNGDVNFVFNDVESGDTYRVCTTIDRMYIDKTSIVGKELLSWASLMAEEIEDGVETTY